MMNALITAVFHGIILLERRCNAKGIHMITFVGLIAAAKAAKTKANLKFRILFLD